MYTAKPRFVSTSSAISLSCPNHLKQQFNLCKPNLIWVSYITYVSVAGKFHYICVVIDLFARKVITYKVCHKIDTYLVIDTFKSAYDKRNQTAGLMFHSDRGSQNNSKEFRKLLDSLSIVQSFSAKGHPYDNAVAESFFKYLKIECNILSESFCFTKLELSILLHKLYKVVTTLLYHIRLKHLLY